MAGDPTNSLHQAWQHMRKVNRKRQPKTILFGVSTDGHLSAGAITFPNALSELKYTDGFIPDSAPIAILGPSGYNAGSCAFKQASRGRPRGHWTLASENYRIGDP